MLLATIVGLAGALGATGRYLTDSALRRRLSTVFPIGTWAVNLVGSFVLGVVATGSLDSASHGDWKAVIGTGFCGGLTTWSAASWETVRLAEEGDWGRALLNGFGGLAASCAAAGAGIALARAAGI